MREIQVEYDIDRPADEVFARLVDARRMTEWRTLESLRVEPDGPLQPGTRLHSVVKGPTGRMTFENEVTRLDGGDHFYADRAVGGTFLIQSSWRVLPRDGGSRIRWTTNYEPRGFLRVLAPMLGSGIRAGQLKDLARLKALLEDGTPAG